MFSGTSVATPVTAGVIALMIAANTRLISAQVESLLYSTADLGDKGRDAVYGYGRVSSESSTCGLFRLDRD